MDKSETFYHFPVFLRIVFLLLPQHSQITYLAKIVQNKSLAKLLSGSLDADFFDLFIMALALPFFHNAGQYFEFQDVVCLLLEKYFGRYEFVH